MRKYWCDWIEQQYKQRKKKSLDFFLWDACSIFCHFTACVSVEEGAKGTEIFNELKINSM